MFEWCEQCEKSEVVINNLMKENALLTAKLRENNIPVGPTLSDRVINRGRV